MELSATQTKLLEEHERLGCINVRKLTAGTRIVLKTADEIYELEVGTPEFGVVLVASDGRFTRRDKRVVAGSVCPDNGIFIPEIIGQGLKVILRRPYYDTVYTGPVYAARVSGKDAEYSFDMWEDE